MTDYRSTANEDHPNYGLIHPEAAQPEPVKAETCQQDAAINVTFDSLREKLRPTVAVLTDQGADVEEVLDRIVAAVNETQGEVALI